ncbi:MAG: BCCT family transporter [Clostridium sp.]|nr:BCCT family transporter [Clostridium sp.]
MKETAAKKNGYTMDWITLTIPFGAIVLMCIAFFLAPEQSKHVLDGIRFFLGDTFGSWYLLVGFGGFLLSLYMAFSDYGKIRLGAPGEKPQYSNFAWGSMMFTSGLAADILFYSLCEWILYAQSPHLAEMGSIQEWSGTYALFHWGPIPWCFYLVLAVAFGYMLHVRGVTKQKYSEAVRPLLGNATDGIAGRMVDLIAVFALLAGTATTFSLATPLLAQITADLLHIPNSRFITILILVMTCIVYTVSVVRGMHGILKLASWCVYLFLGLLAYVLIFGGETVYIIETGISSIGHLAQHFIELSTFTDPLRETSFPQDWTIFYWAYWMVWCVASPFFIGSISRGRTVKQTILGGYICGLGGTFTSFIILGNYSLGLQMFGKLDVIGIYEATEDLYATISEILKTLPLAPLVLVLLAVTMIAFYATSFDAIAMVAASYSYRELPSGEEPHLGMRVFWSIVLILLPIALVFSESSMANLQTVSIIAAFPVSVIIIMIVAAFFKDARRGE